jgi:hypothetical protein
MPSTFTSNTGIEKIADGEQTGLWGQTTNLNLDIIDRSLNGSTSISLSGTTHTLTTSNGLLSDGQFAVLLFAGSPSGTNTVTIAPNTAQKLYFVRNTTAETVILSQGSGATVSVLPGTSRVVFTDGAGAGAAVFDITNTLAMGSVAITGGSINGTTVGATSASTGAFTTLTSSGTTTLNGTTIPASKTLVDTDSAQTLTNKTISGSNNTLSNIANASLTNSSITFGSTAQALGSTVSALNGVTIGATTASTGAFTTLSASTSLTTPLVTNAGTLALSATGANVVTASTNGVERLRVTSGGDVGIGTSSPTSYGSTFKVLEISGSDSGVLNINTGSTIVGQLSNSPNLFKIDAVGASSSLALFTNSTERLRITSAGNVGIGTSSPNAKLDIASGDILVSESANQTSFDRTISAQYPTPSNTSVNNVFRVGNRLSPSFPDRGASIKFVQSGTTIASGELASNIQFWTWQLGVDNGAERMRIDSAGNVGIGTSSIFERMQLSGNFGFISGGYVGFFRNGTTANTTTLDGVTIPQFGVASGVATGRSDASTWLAGFDSLRLVTQGSERMRIDSAGNVGIGTTAPNTALDVNGVITVRVSNLSFGRISTNNTDASNGGLTFQTISGGTFAERARIDASGNLLVGTTTSGGDGLSIQPRVSSGGTTQITFNRSSATQTGDAVAFNNGGTRVGTITYNNTTTAYLTSSDYRLKEDVQPMVGASDRLMALKPVNFAWKVDGSRVDGFLAHEAQEVVPEAVTGSKDAVDKDGKPQYQGIDQSKIVPLLTAALQEALKRIEALEAQINS